MRRILAKRSFLRTALALGAVVLGGQALAQRYLDGTTWPQPPVVTPGENGSAPSDAVVLFDGKNFDAWTDGKGAPLKDWKVDEDGGFTVKGLLQTKKPFGDVQLHLEFAEPKEVKGSGQGRGNNGVGFMGGRYEIQVLDSFNNPTYPEGSCASVYNQRPPMVNASRKPGEWQTYDIVFETPRFDGEKKLTKPGYVTILHNGVLVQNHTQIKGSTHYNQENVYAAHADKEVLVLLYHGNPVRFRNIWLREFKEPVGKEGGKKGIEGK